MAWRTQLRHHFTVPALLLVYAVAALVLACYVGTRAQHSVEVGRLVDEVRTCEQPGEADCLTEVRGGALNGPYNQRRSRNDEWQMVSGDFRDRFGTSPSDSDRLKDAEILGVYAYEDSVAMVATDRGEVRALHVGTRGAVERVVWAVALLGLGMTIIEHAWRKRRQWGGWWAVDGPPLEGQNVVGVVPLVPAMLATGAMGVLGLSWQTSLVVGLVTGAGLVYTILRGARGRSGTTWLRGR